MLVINVVFDLKYIEKSTCFTNIIFGRISFALYVKCKAVYF